MDFTEFRTQYKLSRASLIAGQTTDLDAAQTELRQLADQLTDDQQLAHKLIDDLPATVAAARKPPPEPSAEMLEARRIIDEGKFDEGTREERLAAFDQARKKIWAIADRAGADSDQIRYLTRRFEPTELYLEEGYPWEPPPDSPGA
jgi:outer membrane PBP1 activator LpoA protein